MRERFTLRIGDAKLPRLLLAGSELVAESTPRHLYLSLGQSAFQIYASTIQPPSIYIIERNIHTLRQRSCRKHRHYLDDLTRPASDHLPFDESACLSQVVEQIQLLSIRILGSSTDQDAGRAVTVVFLLRHICPKTLGGIRQLTIFQTEEINVLRNKVGNLSATLAKTQSVLSRRQLAPFGRSRRHHT